MVRAYINSVEVELTGDVILNRNRKESADYGKITILNTRKERYEPLTIVEIGEAGDLEQYVVQADEPLLLKDNLYEHQVNLIETIDVFSTVYPVDRSFTTEDVTIRKVLDTYIRELRFYQDFEFSYVDDSLFDTRLPNKEYSGASLAEIVYDLFRSINAIPRVVFSEGEWVLTHELYTKRNQSIILSVEGEQSTVNDIDYATEVLAKSRNAIDERKFIWYPSVDGYITPRTEGTMFQTSALRYELPDPIMALDKVLTRIDIAGFATLEADEQPYLLNIPDNKYIDIDFTRNVLETQDFNALRSVGRDDSYNYFGEDEDNRVKENCISYDLEGKYIENLFSQISGFLGFTNNIFHLKSAVNANVIYNLGLNYWDDLIDNYLEKGDGSPATENDKNKFKGLRNQEILDVLTGTIPFYITTDTEDIEIRVRYRPKRDIDFVTEKYNIGKLNKSTIMNNQHDSFIDIGQYIENNNALANRIGNVVNNVTQSFNTWAERWQVGDYVGEWLVIDIRYQVDTNNIVCIADLAQGFSNTDREYSMSRQPSVYTYTGKTVQSNFIYRQYIELYEGFDKTDNSLLTDLSKRIALNIFDYDSNYNKPLRHANFYGENQYIDAPLVAVGRGNTLLWHFSFDDPRIAGNGMVKQSQARNGSYAWYKNPLFYGNQLDFTLDMARLTLSNEVNFKEDTETIKYYPEVFVTNDDYWRRINYPLDKDTNASLAFTNQIVIYTNSDDIVIGNAFSKYNNLIQEFDTVPTLKVYRGLSAYTVFDKYVRDTDTLVNGAQINLTANEPYTLTVLDSLDEAIEYWCIAYGDEILIAGNNSVSEIKFNFKRDRERILTVTVIDQTVQPEVIIDVDITEDVNKFEYFVVAPEINITPTINQDISRALYIVNTVQPEIVIDSALSEQVLQIKNVVYVVQPEISINTDITSNVNAAEYETVVVQPTITIDGIVSESVVAQVFVVNTVMPIITLDTSVESDNTALIQYTITYNLDGGVNDSSNKDTFYLTDLPFTLFPAGRKDGHKFDGWYDNASFTGSENISVTSVGNKEYWAKWLDVNMTWEASTESAWNNDPEQETVTNTTNADTSPGVPADNYWIGQVVRVSDGAFPTPTYYYYRAIEDI